MCKIPGSDFSNSYKCKEEWLKLQTDYQNGKENYEVREQKPDLCMAYEKKRKKKAMNSPEKKSEKLVTALCSMSLNGISTPTLRRVSGM